MEMEPALPDLPSGKIVLVLAAHGAQEVLLELAAGLARRGPLRVLDGGNRFNAYRLARLLRRQTPELSAALNRISLARAFTCYQVETLVAASSADPPMPTLILDLLSTFYDESVSLGERRWLLERCMQHLRRLGEQAPVAVSAQPALPAQAERASLLRILQEAADQVWEMEAPTLPAPPPRLF